MTNYERIKAMSVEEMARLIDDIQTDALFLEGTINDLKYSTEWEEWLNSEVEEKAASELIDKQQAEIERLKSMNQAKLDCIHDLQKENEKLTNEVDSLKKQMEWLTGYNQNLMSANTALSGEIFIAKSEAYKEFAERLKSYLLLNEKEKISVITFEDVEKLLKELVGENK